MQRIKPFKIEKSEVWEAYLRVKSKGGAAGVDRESLSEFKANEKQNLYKLWNRMSSGSYFPPPVLAVRIPKAKGGLRCLGIPTVADRIAQQVVKQRLEPLLEPHFHNNSYGYRPGKRAHEAIRMARYRCWERDWVLDIDIQGFFDNLDHGLLMKALRKHVSCRWMLLYIERWLKAPLQTETGEQEVREKGTPQGGVISPLLANLFLHYAFDMWLVRQARNIRFERYADDIVCHCDTREQAERLREKLSERLLRCGLQLHPEKTHIAYCRDEKRRERHVRCHFDFLGYTFKPRKVRRSDGRYTLGFVPAMSATARKRIWYELRVWGFRRRVNMRLQEVADYWNPILRGWLYYYGYYYRSELHRVLEQLDRRLAQWLTNKYNRTRGRIKRGLAKLYKLKKRDPTLFAHWEYFQIDKTA